MNSGSGNITITGVPLNYTPGSTVAITVTVTQTDATIYGFQLTAVDELGDQVGEFAFGPENPPQTQITDNFVGQQIRVYIGQNTDGLIPTVLGSKSWTFNWIPPMQSVGRVNFYAAGNAANSDNSPSGDYVYTTTAFSMPSNSFTVGGRVFTPAGAGLRNATVTMTDPDGGIRTATTNSFGFYTFTEVPGGPTYVMRVSSKRYRFAAQQVPVTQSLSDINFTGLE